MLFVTINDWPARTNLSGQTNKGYNACTHCLDAANQDLARRSEELEADLLEDLKADEELEEDLDGEHEADEDETSACAPYLARQMS